MKPLDKTGTPTLVPGPRAAANADLRRLLRMQRDYESWSKGPGFFESHPELLAVRRALEDVLGFPYGGRPRMRDGDGPAPAPQSFPLKAAASLAGERVKRPGAGRASPTEEWEVVEAEWSREWPVCAPPRAPGAASASAGPPLSAPRDFPVGTVWLLSASGDMVRQPAAAPPTVFHMPGPGCSGASARPA